MKIKTFVPRTKSVRAVQLQAENSIEVAKWCGARVLQPGNIGFSGAYIQLPNGEEAKSNDWIVKEMRKLWPTSSPTPHFYALHNTEFCQLWKEEGEERQLHPSNCTLCGRAWRICKGHGRATEEKA